MTMSATLWLPAFMLACAPVGETPEQPLVAGAANASPVSPESAPASAPTPASEPATAASSGAVEPSAPGVNVAAEAAPAPMPQTTAFAVEFYRHIAKTPGNVSFSPFSISAALAMTYGGARGDTAAEFERVVWNGQEAASVHESYGRLLATWRGEGQQGVELRVANRMFGQTGFRFEPAFVKLTGATYGAELAGVDFRTAADESRRTINRWVAEQTRDRIEELLYPGTVHGATRLVLVNAMYFKGDWTQPFEASNTQKAKFTTSTGKRVKVPLMQAVRTTTWYQDDEVTVAELPYAGGSMVMDVVLPRDAKGLAAVEAALSAEKIERWTGGMSPARLDVKLPRFRLSAEKSTPLRKVLEAMGLNRAFDAKRADFTGITTSEQIWVDDVIHQTFIEVNEEGTEAAAATGTTMRVYAMAQTHPFYADRPFLFFIRDKKSNQLLFFGRVDDPS